MNFSQILCVPDLLRGVRSFPEGFFDLVREPILQGTGLHIGFPPEINRPHALPADFNLGKFRELANVDMDSEQQQSQWSVSYYRIPAPALDYLFKYIASDSLVFSFEIPPWFANACLDRGIHFIDMRPSPLRFGRDLYIALRCSDARHLTRIAAHTVLDEEIRLEASMLAANVRMHQRRMVDDRGYTFSDLQNSLIFIGQAPYDASLLTPEGKSAHCTDYTQQLRQLCSGKRLLHKAHPFATDFSAQERAQLATITGQPVTACPLNAYQILSSHDALELAGISSGLLQEASYFGKTAYTLFQPFVPLAEQPTTDDYQQIHFDTFLSPGFWHSVLTPEKAEPRLKKLPAIAHHHARETLDHWWDYSKVMTWERSFTRENFERSGGILLRQRIEALEQGSLQNKSMVMNCDDGNHVEWSPRAQVRGKIAILGKGNTVTMADGVNFDATITITGNNNQIHINENVRFAGRIFVWGSGGHLKFGRNSTFARVEIKCHEGRSISIGNDCMFSYDIELRTTDGHSIVDVENGRRINPPEDIVIGDHVWVGKGVTILKRTNVPDDCIIGANALLNSIYEKSQTVLAGSPAKIIKEAVTWHREAKPEFTCDELTAWQALAESTSGEAGHSSDEPHVEYSHATENQNWLACLADIRKKIDAYPQKFGRGDLYQAHEAWGVKGQRPTLQRIREYDLDRWLPAHASVLDIGCNIGMFGLALSNKIDRYYGFDNNPLLIDIARQMADVRDIHNCRFECESFQDFSSRNKGVKFNALFSFAVHVWIGMSIAEYARTVYELLHPGGILIWESNRLDTNDQDFFQNVHHFISAGFAIQSCGKLKDDNIIERGFYVLAKLERAQ